jgi:hypothetical protein
MQSVYYVLSISVLCFPIGGSSAMNAKFSLSFSLLLIFSA